MSHEYYVKLVNCNVFGALVNEYYAECATLHNLRKCTNLTISHECYCILSCGNCFCFSFVFSSLYWIYFVMSSAAIKKLLQCCNYTETKSHYCYDVLDCV